MSQQKTYNPQYRVSSQERLIWPKDGADILLFKRLSGDRGEVPLEPALSLHEADLVRCLLRFLRLNAYCSFIKSCGGSDTFKGLHLAFQLFLESLDDEGWNIEKESLCPCDLWGWAVATTVKIVEGFCDCGELLRNLIIEGADTGLFFIAPINSVTLDNSHDADFDKRRRLHTFGFSRVSSIEESRSFNLTTWLGPTFVLAAGRFLMHKISRTMFLKRRFL